MVRPLKPDDWPCSTDEERAAGWREPRFRRSENRPENPRTEAGRAMLRDPMYRFAIGHVLAIEEQAADEWRRAYFVLADIAVAAQKDKP